ncbi:putative lipid II flippase FtsW [Desulfacinum hydrothermale]|nr:putative lipid II flippase FtsW [Desulfacinum hydrothermale]
MKSANYPGRPSVADGEEKAPFSLGLREQIWVILLALLAFGVLMVYSASAPRLLRGPESWSGLGPYANRQLCFALLGIALAAVMERIPYRWYGKAARPALLLVLAALALVWIPGVGVEINSAQRWFRIGSFTAQPSELAKVTWVVYLSAYVCRKREVLGRFRTGILPTCLLLGLLSALLLLEPDFGSCVILAGMSFVIWALGGVPWHHLLLLVPVGLSGLGALAVTSPYRLKRLLAFLDPWTDPLASGYHLIQSLVAVGSGGVWGVGLGAGRQKLAYLPEPFTDFIVAVVGEELGLVGLTGLTLAVLALFWKGLQVARRARDPFGAVLAAGLTCLVAFQAWINMGVVLGLLPTKGLAFPFLSYGGSSLTANCMAVGMILSVARRSQGSAGVSAKGV